MAGRGRSRSQSRTPPPKRTSRRVIPNDVAMQETDAESVNTVQHNNGTRGTISHKQVTYFLLWTSVIASKQGTETMRKQFISMLTTLRAADESVVLTPYKTTITQADDGSHVHNIKDVISDPNKLPDSITGLSKFFYGARPNSTGGSIWTDRKSVV